MFVDNRDVPATPDIDNRPVDTDTPPDTLILQARLSNWLEQADGAFADNTERARASDWRIWAQWCQQHRTLPLPASEGDISSFLIDVDRKPATLRRYLSTLATAHRAADLSDPTRSEVVQLTLRKLTRLKGRAQEQAPGLSWPELQLILAQPRQRLIDNRDRALLIVMYDCLLRRSEVPGIVWSHIETGNDGSGTLYLPHSKTDQLGDGQYRYLSPLALQLLLQWQQKSGLKEGSVFRGVYNGNQTAARAISTEGVSRAIQRAGKLLGKRLSGHSLRVGAAQDLTTAGIGISAIMQAGGWQTERMPALYARKLRAAQSGMAQLAARQNR